MRISVPKIATFLPTIFGNPGYFLVNNSFFELPHHLILRVGAGITTASDPCCQRPGVLLREASLSLSIRCHWWHFHCHHCHYCWCKFWQRPKYVIVVCPPARLTGWTGRTASSSQASSCWKRRRNEKSVSLVAVKSISLRPLTTIPCFHPYLSWRARPAPLCVVFGCSSMALVTLACRCVALLFIIGHLLLLKVLAHKSRSPSCSSVILNVWLGAADQILQHPLSFSSSSSFFFSKQQQNQNQ